MKKLIESMITDYFSEINDINLNEDNASADVYNQRINNLLSRFTNIDKDFQRKINLYVFLKMILSDKNPDKLIEVSPLKVRAWSKKLGKDTLSKLFDTFLKSEDIKEISNENNDALLKEFKNNIKIISDTLSRTYINFDYINKLHDKINELKRILPSYIDNNTMESYNKYYFNNFADSLDKWGNAISANNNVIKQFYNAAKNAPYQDMNIDLSNQLYDSMETVIDNKLKKSVDKDELSFNNVNAPETLTEFINRIKTDVHKPDNKINDCMQQINLLVKEILDMCNGYNKNYNNIEEMMKKSFNLLHSKKA